MVTCLVWAAVLVVLVLLILVVFWSMIVGAFPIWPPIAIGLVTFLILTRPRIPEALVRLIAALSAFGLAIDLPTGVPNYFLAMRELGYTGSFGSSLGAVPVDWARLLELGLPLSILAGTAIGSLLALRSRSRNPPRPDLTLLACPKRPAGGGVDSQSEIGSATSTGIRSPTAGARKS